jgi:DNA recombination protein RmuC
MGGVMAGMEWATLGVGCGVGLVIGLLAGWLAVGLRARATQARLEAELAGERRIGAERIATLEAGESRLREAFEALSRQALDLNSRSFLELARTKLGEFQQGARGDLEARQTAIGELLRPVRDSLERLDGSLRRVETTHGALSEKVLGLHQSEQRLVAETATLSLALRTPGVRGRWGEVQLRRVVELAGMVDHCDFDEQVTATCDDSRLRPDLVVRLPGGRNIVVDAKAVMRAYLDAEQTTDEAERQRLLVEHARLVREHMTRLAGKAYREQFEPGPEFVVMFLPGENFFRAALEVEPDLIDRGVAQRVVLASPINLISILWGAAQAWREQRMTETAQQVCDTGRELYKRVSILAEHFETLRKCLLRSVEAYNAAVGSLDRRVLPAARRFKDLGAASGPEIEPLEPVDVVPEAPQAPELLPLFDPARRDDADERAQPTRTGAA